MRGAWKEKIPGLVFGAILIIWAVSEEPTLGGGPGFGLAQTLVAMAGVLSIVLALTWRKMVPLMISLTLSLGVALVLAEIIIGGAYAPKYATPFEYDAKLHYRLVPGAVREYQHHELNGGDKFRYQVNADGFRGPELVQDDPSLRRVVVYGDSFIHGEYSRQENTFVHQLKLALDKQYEDRFELVNAGVAGYGPDQSLLRMKSELQTLKPDLVVIAVYTGNDFGDLVRNKLFRLDEQGVLIENEFILPETTLNGLKLSNSEPIIRKMLRDLAATWRGQKQRPQQSPEARVERFLEQHIAEYEQYITENNNVVGDLQEDPYTADISILGRTASSAAYKIRLMEAVLRQMKELLDAESIPVVLVAIPHPIDALRGEHDTGRVDASVYPGYDSDLLVNSLVSIGTDLDFPTVNLLPHFRAHDPVSLYFRGGDDHWNDKGQALAAGYVADFINQHGVLAE